MQKLKDRWGIESNIQVILIFIAFAVNGSFAAWVAKPLTTFFGISIDVISPLLYWPLRIILIFIVYQSTLPLRLQH